MQHTNTSNHVIIHNSCLASVGTDSLLGSQSVLVRSAVSGAVLSGILYLTQGDSKFWVSAPVGSTSYFLADRFQTWWNKDVSTTGAEDIPVVEGM